MFGRLFAALPPTLTAALYGVGLFAPLRLGSQRVADLIVAMLVEIFVIIAIAPTALALKGEHPFRQAAMTFAALSVFGLLFVAFFAIAFDAAWALLSFPWLAFSAFLPLLLSCAPLASKVRLLLNGTAVSGVALVVAYGVGVVLLAATPFGFTPAAIAALALPQNGSGAFLDRPWTAIGTGAAYFALIALARAFDLRLVRD
jgi:hypothetical protein